MASSATIHNVVNALKLRCSETNDWGPVEELVSALERRISDLEHDNVERITATVESETLRKLLTTERETNADVKRQLDALIFRTSFQISGKLTEDSVPDDKSKSLEQQATIIINSFELDDVPNRPVELDGLSRHEAMAALQNQAVMLKQAIKQSRQFLRAQVIERLQLKRAVDSINGNANTVEKQLEEARKNLNREREASAQIVSGLRAQVKAATEKALSLENRLFTEMESMRRSAKERESKLEGNIQRLSSELERLRTVERRLLRAESELEEVRATAQELRSQRAADARRVSEASNTVRLAVLTELQKCSKQFDALPLAMKMGHLVSREAESSKFQKDDLLVSNAGTEALAYDLREHFQALAATITYIGKLLQEKVPAEVEERMEQERSRLAEIALMRKKVNEALFKMDTQELGEDVVAAVDEYVELEKRMKKVRQSVRRSVTTTVDAASAVADVEAALEKVEQSVDDEAFHIAHWDGNDDMHEARDASDQLDYQITARLLTASREDQDTLFDGLTPMERQVIPQLQNALGERQIEMLLRRSMSVAPSSIVGDPTNNAAAAASAKLAGHMQSPTRKSLAELVASAEKLQSVSEASRLVLPPLRNNKMETQVSRSPLFGSVAQYASDVAVARDIEASSLLHDIDSQRLLNLKTCLSVLENSQREYAKSKGIRLPPMDTLEIDSDTEIGRPMVKCAGGPMTGKLWRATQQPQRKTKSTKDPKKNPKLSVTSSTSAKKK